MYSLNINGLDLLHILFKYALKLHFDLQDMSIFTWYFIWYDSVCLKCIFENLNSETDYRIISKH